MFPGFDGLMTLSRREGVDIRPTLLRVLTDLYVQASAHTAEEEQQFVELASRLIDRSMTRRARRPRASVDLSAHAAGDPHAVIVAARPPACADAAGRSSPRRSYRLFHVRRPKRNCARRRNWRCSRRTPPISPRCSLRQARRARTDPRQSARHAVETVGADRGDAGRRAIEALEAAAFAADIETLHDRTRQRADAARRDRRADRQRSRPRAAGLRAESPRHARAMFQRVLMFLDPGSDRRSTTSIGCRVFTTCCGRRAALIMLAAWRGATLRADPREIQTIAV